MPFTSNVEGRVHRQLLMQPVGKHISNCASLKELVGGIIDTIEGIFKSFIVETTLTMICLAHRTLCTNKILHRDISVNNILLTSGEEGQRSCGLLIDYDYAFWYKDQNPKDVGTSASEYTDQEVLLHCTVSISITY